MGDADSMDWVDLADAAALFARIGLPAPGRAPLIPLDHQVAQKLHALTGPGDRHAILLTCSLSLPTLSSTLLRRGERERGYLPTERRRLGLPRSSFETAGRDSTLSRRLDYPYFRTLPTPSSGQTASFG